MLVDARMDIPEHQVVLDTILQVVLDIILREVCLQEKLCASMLQPTVRFFARRCLVQILT